MSNLIKNSVWGVAKQNQQVFGVIQPADIVGTGVGQFGHANGVPIALGATFKVTELVSLILIYNFAVAAYTAGGNITVNISGGGAALTGLISAANSVGAGANRVVQFNPLTVAALNLTSGLGFNLVSSAAFTQPGTAAGVIRYIANFRQYDVFF